MHSFWAFFRRQSTCTTHCACCAGYTNMTVTQSWSFSCYRGLKFPFVWDAQLNIIPIKILLTCFACHARLNIACYTSLIITSNNKTRIILLVIRVLLLLVIQVLPLLASQDFLLLASQDFPLLASQDFSLLASQDFTLLALQDLVLFSNIVAMATSECQFNLTPFSFLTL